MTRTLLFADAHLESGTAPDPAYELMKTVVKKEKFDRIVCLGDLMDFSYISQWTEGMPGLTEGRRLKEDFQLVSNELKFFKKYAKDVTLLMGNHEDRVQKFVWKNPVLEGILSLKEICDENEVTFVPTNQQPYRLMADFFVTHGLSINKYFASQLVQNSGVSIVQGHAHRTQTFSYRYPDGRVVTGVGLGTLGPLNPDYVAGQRVTGWTQSFGILYAEGDQWQIDVISVNNKRCIINGKLFNLTA